MTKQIWSLKNNALYWQVEKGFYHRDDIEMSGLYADYIVYYGVKEDGTLCLSQRCYFPTLRTIPNNTHGTFCFALEESERPVFIHDGEVIKEYPVSFVLDGTLKVNTKTEKGICISRCFFPATDSKCCYERVTVTAEKETEIYADQRLILISTTVASGKDKNLKGRMPQPKPLEIKTVVPFMS